VARSPFRAYDIRGVYEKDITKEFALKLGYVLGKFIEDERIVVGNDTRSSSPVLAERLINGLLVSRKNVDYVGDVPNPVTYYYCWRGKMPGVYVTASHNPPEYNGFKLIRRDGTSFTHEYREIKKLFYRTSFPKEITAAVGSETVRYIDVAKDYLDFITSQVDIKHGVKVVVETFGGVVNKVLPTLFDKLGVKYKILHPRIKGNFYGYRPEPAENNLDLLKEKIVAFGADFGVAFDGDADRSVFVDNKGRVLNGSQAGAVLALFMVEKGDTVVLTPDTSIVLKKLIEDIGGKIVYSRIGHGFIEEKVRDTGAVLGIEQSSHFYFGKYYPFSDGILAAAIMAQVASHFNISAIVDKYPVFPMEKIYINAYDDETKRKVVSLLRKEHQDAVAVYDGFKVFFDDAWVLIRESQTMPEVNLVIEASTREKLEELKEKYVKKIKEAIRLVNKNKS